MTICFNKCFIVSVKFGRSQKVLDVQNFIKEQKERNKQKGKKELSEKISGLNQTLARIVKTKK